MTSAQRKAIKTHRSRLQKRGMKRLEVVVRVQDASLVRDVAETLRRNDVAALRLRSALRSAVGKGAPTIADVIKELPDISGPEFDSIFQEIERFRHAPVMLKVRDVEL
jgi:predicted ATPase